MEKVRRLTLSERYQIQALLASNRPIREISRLISRSASTISREIVKGVSKDRVYDALVAEGVTRLLRASPRAAKRKLCGCLEKHVRKKLIGHWSPEQIANRLRQDRRRKRFVSHMTIYRYLERDKANSGKLWKNLRILRKQRKNRKSPKWRRAESSIPNRKMIDERPKVVEKRNRLGDVERDSVLGRRGGSIILTVVDRTSRLVKLAWVERKTAELVHKATVECLRGHSVRTITNDNGTEFAHHEKTAKKLGAKIYFNRSFRSWERGTNENLNGLLRQYFPKKKPIGNPTKQQIKQIEWMLNSRPRKCLGYRTPYEVHKQLRSEVLRSVC